MNRPRLVLVAALMLLLPSAVLIDSPYAPTPRAEAAKNSSLHCPKKIGGFKNRRSDVGDQVDSLQCFYERRPGDVKNGQVRVAVHWSEDFPDDRIRCASRQMAILDGAAGGPEDFNRSMSSPDAQASVTYYVTPGKRVKRQQAEKAALALLAQAVEIASPCVPPQEPVPAGEFACPLVVGDSFVRNDWYGGDDPFIERGSTTDTADFYAFECRYGHAFKDEGSFSTLSVSWAEGDPADRAFQRYCRADESDDGFFLKAARGVYPVQLRSNSDLAAAGGTAVLDQIASAAEELTVLCSGEEGVGVRVELPPDLDPAIVAAIDAYDAAIDGFNARTDEIRERDAESVSLVDTARAFEEDGDTARAQALIDRAAVLFAETEVAQSESYVQLSDELAGVSLPGAAQDSLDEITTRSSELADLWRMRSQATVDEPETIGAIDAALGPAQDALASALGALEDALLEELGL